MEQNSFRRHLPLLIGTGILWATIALLLATSIKQNQGHLIYTLDDPYIHMAMAKNTAEHGVWGVDRYQFSSSSSPPLWTLILTFVSYLFGPKEIAPFVINVIFATIVVFEAYLFLKRHTPKMYVLLPGLVTLLFSAPLPSLVFSGQEHTMQIAISLLFLFLSARAISANKTSFRERLPLLIVAPLLTALRYEGLFLVAVACVLFLLRGRLIFSLLLGCVALVPVVIYGFISMLKGWYFLPNPIILKSNLPTVVGIREILDDFVSRTVRNPCLSVVVFVSLFFYFRSGIRRSFWERIQVMTVIFVGTSILHMMLADVGWFYRYEAYLFAIGILVVTFQIHKYVVEGLPLLVDIKFIPKNVIVAIVVLPVCLVCLARSYNSAVRTPRATSNIYQQQYQMGLFLAQFYQGDCVGLNDIGAATFLADIRCLDFWGLASLDAAKLRLSRRFTTEEMDRLARQKGAKIAIVYDSWYEKYGGVPATWTKVATWTIKNNVVCGDDVVSFYALNQSDAADLLNNLKVFSMNAPEGVEQTFFELDLGDNHQE